MSFVSYLDIFASMNTNALQSAEQALKLYSLNFLTLW
jgi:hypothetical protein